MVARKWSMATSWASTSPVAGEPSGRGRVAALQQLGTVAATAAGTRPEGYSEDPTPPSYPPDSMPQRSTVPPVVDATRGSTPLSPTGRTRPSSPPDSSLISAHPSRPGDSPQSRASQSMPPGKPVPGAGPLSPSASHSSDDRATGGDRSWPPRSTSGVGPAVAR